MNRSSFRKLSSMAIAVAAATAFTGVNAAQLEEIVVTAQKRTESLQDVPISITTLDGGKIEAAGMNNLEDLTAFVPNLMLTENAVATSIVMRGVGPGANQSFEQSVGLYVDGVHLGKGRQTRTGFFDLAQVEVLYGPQGVLFGKNTLAGAINVTSATPRVGDEFGGKISVGVESNSGRSVEGNIGGSIGDNFAMRFAFKDRSDDGYLTNSFTGNDGPSTDETLWRLSATWEPNDNTVVKFKHAEGDHRRLGATSVVNFIEPTQNLSASARLLYGILGAFYPEVASNAQNNVFDANRDAIAIGGNALSGAVGGTIHPGERPEGTDTQNSDTSLNIDVDFGDGYTFTSVTGYSEYEYEDALDADFLPVRFIGRSDNSEYDQFSQEFRIASDPSKKFSFITGAYIEEQTQIIDRIVAFDGQLGLPASTVAALTGVPTLLFAPPFLAGAFGAPVGVNGISAFNQAGRISRWQQDTSAWAVFFQGKYQINDTLSLTAGIRYTEETKDATGSMRITTDATGLGTHNPNPILGLTLRGVTPNTWDHDYVDTRTTDQLIPEVTLEWEKSGDTLFYVRYAEGFKSGGFNAVDDQAPFLAGNITDSLRVHTEPGAGWRYEDETANSIAIGGKHTLADGSVNFNWEAFTSEYEDQQVSTFVGIGFVVRNAASSNVDGLEMDIKWQATDNLLLGANLAFLDATYGSFPTAGCTQAQLGIIAGGASSSGGCTVRIGADGNSIANQDLKGGKLNQAPDYSGAIYADYSRSFSDSIEWYTSVDLNFTDDYSTTGDLDPIDGQEAFQKINLRTGIRGESWDLMLYGKNITDEETSSGGFDVPLASGTHAIYTDPGSIYGARFTYNF